MLLTWASLHEIVFVPVILAFLIRVHLKIELRSREVCVP